MKTGHGSETETLKRDMDMMDRCRQIQPDPVSFGFLAAT